ncbi:MAG TPA: hypothetical protein VF533_07245 [Solirubrobacteraceae bacterium]|jgi:phospholipase/carboxylesterase
MDPARLAFRPAEAPPPGGPRPGLHTLPGGRDGRPTLLYVPESAGAGARPAPLAVSLHGAGSTGERGLAILRDHADAAGLAVLAPSSRTATWDVIAGGFGPDVAAIDAALAAAATLIAVDPAHLLLAGFSDGASYALSLGLSNGDLFTHLLAFSPGFAAPARRQGSPRIFMTHGTEDRVLPIDRCSRRLAPRLRDGGYDVDYREFDGGHVVPGDLAAAAVGWALADRG